MFTNAKNKLSPTEKQERRTGYLFILVFLVLSAAIALGGAFYYRGYTQSYRVEVERQISAVAELKVDDITQWRKERLGDASLFFKNAAFSASVRRFFAKPEDPEARGEIESWMAKLQACRHYDRVRLLDPQGTTVLSNPGNIPALSSSVSQRLSEVLRTGQITWLDFYRDGDDSRIYLILLVPLLDEQDGNRPLGVLSFRVDPETWLYPMINRWPTASETAETLIVRRDGNDALFLNQLRFNKDTALKLRIPLSKTGAVCVDTVTGKEGILEGVDYRGVPVLAATRRIPDSPWFLVARMDHSEVDAPVRQRLLQIILLGGSLLFSAMVSVSLLWRQQRMRLYRERLETALTLRQSEEHYRSLFANMINGFARCKMLFDEQGRANDLVYLEVNASFEKLTGLKNVVGKRITEVIPGIREMNPELIQFYGRVVRTGIPERTEVFAAPLQTWFDILAYKSEPECFVAVFDTITERKKAEEQVRQTLAELERSNRELQQFAHVASHDLQEPLRMVGSYVQLLEQEYGQHLGEEAGKWIQYAVEGAERMRRLLNDLLNYTRVGTRPNPLGRVDCADVLRDAVANLQEAIRESGAEVAWDDLPTVMADSVQMMQLFQNLIGNAVKFHGPEAPRIRIGAHRQDKLWLFSVRDNGIGIEKRHADRIFSMFQRLHTRSEYLGSGIGLAICRKIVDRHGGSIWVESVSGEGSTFHFTWPTAMEDPSGTNIAGAPEMPEPERFDP